MFYSLSLCCSSLYNTKFSYEQGGQICLFQDTMNGLTVLVFGGDLLVHIVKEQRPLCNGVDVLVIL